MDFDLIETKFVSVVCLFWSVERWRKTENLWLRISMVENGTEQLNTSTIRLKSKSTMKMNQWNRDKPSISIFRRLSPRRIEIRLVFDVKWATSLWIWANSAKIQIERQNFKVANRSQNFSKRIELQRRRSNLKIGLCCRKSSPNDEENNKSINRPAISLWSSVLSTTKEKKFELEQASNQCSFLVVENSLEFHSFLFSDFLCQQIESIKTNFNKKINFHRKSKRCSTSEKFNIEERSNPEPRIVDTKNDTTSSLVLCRLAWLKSEIFDDRFRFFLQKKILLDSKSKKSIEFRAKRFFIAETRTTDETVCFCSILRTSKRKRSRRRTEFESETEFGKEKSFFFGKIIEIRFWSRFETKIGEFGLVTIGAAEILKETSKEAPKNEEKLRFEVKNLSKREENRFELRSTFPDEIEEKKLIFDSISAGLMKSNRFHLRGKILSREKDSPKNRFVEKVFLPEENFSFRFREFLFVEDFRGNVAKIIFDRLEFSSFETKNEIFLFHDVELFEENFSSSKKFFVFRSIGNRISFLLQNESVNCWHEFSFFCL